MGAFIFKIATNNAGYTEKLKNDCYLSPGATVEILLFTSVILICCAAIPSLAETTLLFTDQTQPAGIHFTDIAITVGVAYNSEGRATASMGIASGDYDNDGVQDMSETAGRFFKRSVVARGAAVNVSAN